MSQTEKEEIDARVQSIISRELDAKLRKVLISVWIMIAGALGTLIFLGVEWGTLKNQVHNNAVYDDRHHNDKTLHMSTDDKFKTFVPRTEWVSFMGQHNAEVSSIRAQLVRIEDKLDDVRNGSQ